MNCSYRYSSCVRRWRNRRHFWDNNGVFSFSRLSIFLVIAVLLSSICLSASDNGYSFRSGSGTTQQEDEPGSKQARWRVLSLKHIPAEKGRRYLSDANICTVSRLPGREMLLVTGEPMELIKASAITRLVDSESNYVIRHIAPASSAPNLPSSEQIEEELGDVQLGSFIDPPLDRDKTRIILDVHGDSVVAIAPENEIDRILSKIAGTGSEKEKSAKAPAKLRREMERVPAGERADTSVEEANSAESGNLSSAEDRKQRREDVLEIVNQKEAGLSRGQEENEPDEDELFGRLLQSLDKAEKKAGEPEKKEVAEPAEKVAGGPNEPDNKFFNGLLRSLDEAEKSEKPAKEKEPKTEEAAAEGVAAGPNEPAEIPAAPAAEKEEAKDKEFAALQRRLARIERLLQEQAARREEKGEPEEKEPNRPEPEEAGPEKLEPEKVPKIELPEKIGEVNEVNEVNEANLPEEKAKDYEPQQIPNGENVLSLDLPEQLPLTDFLSFVAEHLELDYLYDPQQIKGNVTLRLHGKLRGKVRVKDLYPLLESVMHFYGFSMTRKDDLVMIRPMKQAGDLDTNLIGPDGGGVETGDVVVTRVFELENIDTASAKNFLTRMKLGIAIEEIPETGTLFVTGYSYRMKRMEKILEMIDKPGEPKEFRFRELDYTRADALMPKVEKLVEQLGEISITVAQPKKKQRPKGPRRRRPARKKAAQKGSQPQPSEPTVYLDYDERTNRVLMIGYAEQLDVVEELIDTLDVEQKDLRTLRLYEIQYVGAEDVLDKLGQLGIVSGAGGRTRRGRITDRRRQSQKGQNQPARPAAAGTREEALSEEPQVVTIESINGLLVNATPEQHAQVAQIIGYVDSETEASTIPYVVYQLENQDPDELAGVLTQLIQETTETKDEAGKIVKTTKQLTEEQISIIPDPKTYSLIVYASKKNQQWISSLIEQLDEYRPQVLLDVTLVEIRKTDEFKYDLNIIESFPDLTTTTDLIGDEAVLPPGASGSGRDRFIEFGPGSGDFAGGGFGFYADKHVNFLLEAMQNKNYGRILARPKLLVNDNETGTITAQTTDYKPQVKSSFATGEGGTSQQESVDFATYTAGVTLEIQPHISKGDQLQLLITLNRSDFGEEEGSVKVGGNEIPVPRDQLTSDVNTKITVPDGRTIILGGLEKLNQSKGGKKVPVLGDIPIIGGLFRSISNSSDQSKLYVFIKAHILRPGTEVYDESDVIRISKEHRKKFEESEKEMQEYEDWPGIKPKPLDPTRILEED